MIKKESRKTRLSNKTTEIRNKNSRINFKNRAILLSNIGGKPSKQVEPKKNVTEVCEGIVELNERQQAKLEEIVISKIPEIGTELKQTEYKIDVQGHDPIKQRYYHVSPKGVREEINEDIDEMLKQGIIEPSCSDWSNPIVMIKKPNGEYRFCLDFRKVNKITKKKSYPIPQMKEILDTLRSVKSISKIYLKSAYLQIPLEENSKLITAFTVPGKGMYQFKWMPFVLTNAPGTFQRLMDKTITPDLKPNVFCYLDDIIIVTQNFDDHLKYLNLVLDEIKKNKFNNRTK